MIIGIDIDNTLSDTHETIRAYAERYAREEAIELHGDPHCYVLEDFFGMVYRMGGSFP